MQTFLPYTHFISSAQCLDNRRLGKQRVEAKQILECLGGTKYERWRNHPAVKMWRGHEQALANYGFQICAEWRRRGYVDNLMPYFDNFLSLIQPNPRKTYLFTYPPWFGDITFHRSHQSNLVRKLPEHYRKYFPDVPDNLPYYWPSNN